MKKVLKRLAIVLSLLLLTLLIAGVVTWRQAHRVPDFYKPYLWQGEQRAIVNQRAVEKITLAENMLAKAAAEELHNRRSAATQPGASMTLTFSEEELNAFLTHNFGNVYEQYLKDPGIFLRDHQIILAAEVHELGIPVSLCFEPSIDRDGRFNLRLAKCMAGRVAVPKTFLGALITRVRGGLVRRLPEWQAKAKLERNGGANSSAVAAATAKLIINALDEKPADPVLFLPREGGVSLPLLLKDLQLEGDSIKLGLRSLSAQERQQAVSRIREPLPQ